ncbi:hypothetical protein LJC21_01570, partial [Bacteroides sp. OttesenSCG-928-E20]|nr:hypothetical protein [Bacteroides sp. OttesenSCG-928-E20]
KYSPGRGRTLLLGFVCLTTFSCNFATVPIICGHTPSSGIYQKENFKASAAAAVFSAEEEFILLKLYSFLVSSFLFYCYRVAIAFASPGVVKGCYPETLNCPLLKPTSIKNETGKQ